MKELIKYLTTEELQKMNKTRLLAYRKTVYREIRRTELPFTTDDGDLIFEGREEQDKCEAAVAGLQKYLAKVNLNLEQKG